MKKILNLIFTPILYFIFFIFIFYIFVDKENLYNIFKDISTNYNVSIIEKEVKNNHLELQVNSAKVYYGGRLIADVEKIEIDFRKVSFFIKNINISDYFYNIFNLKKNNFDVIGNFEIKENKIYNMDIFNNGKNIGNINIKKNSIEANTKIENITGKTNYEYKF